MRMTVFHISSIVFIIGSFSVFGQSIDLNGGFQVNQIVMINQNSHFESTYDLTNNYSVSIGVEDVQIDYLTMRFALSLSNYSGELIDNYSGLAGGSKIEAEFQKTTITLGLFPVSFYLFDHVNFNVGIYISRRIHEEFSGIKSGCFDDAKGGFDCHQLELGDKYNSLCLPWTFGIQSRIAYDFYLSESLILTPSYIFSLGLSNEFSIVSRGNRLMSHIFYLGIEKRIGK
jgi:hypothetical protein